MHVKHVIQILWVDLWITLQIQLAQSCKIALEIKQFITFVIYSSYNIFQIPHVYPESFISIRLIEGAVDASSF